MAQQIVAQFEAALLFLIELVQKSGDTADSLSFAEDLPSTSV